MFIILHGPLEADILSNNLLKIQAASKEYQVILSVYNNELDQTNEIVRGLSISNSVTVIGSDDVFNPGFYNVNRQINLVNSALDFISDDDAFLLKVRMDQTINFKWAIKIFTNRYDQLSNKLISTNCYTRNDRLYHPSDMFLAGTKKTLRKYYPTFYFPDTHMDNVLKIKEMVLSGENVYFHKFWPESRLFMNYLMQSGEDLKENKECSEEQLKKHVYLFNSWDIGLKWKKFCGGKIYVLPYFFTLRPFDGGPLEKAENYLASELVGFENKYKELLYNNIAKLYFKSGLYIANPIFVDYRKMTLNILRRIYKHSYKYTPSVMHDLMYKIAKRIYYAFK